MMNRKNAAAAALCGLLCAATAVGGTLAYLTDRENITNTFTVGSVKIEESEPNYDPDPDDEITHDIVPNEEIEKDPQLKNVGRNDAFVYMQVTIPVAEVITADEDGKVLNNGQAVATELFSMNDLVLSGSSEDGGWYLMEKAANEDGDMVYTYLYDQILKPEDSTKPLFTSVTFVNLVEGQLDEETIKIPVTSYAIQTLNTADDGSASVIEQAKSAWQKYEAQNTAQS